MTLNQAAFSVGVAAGGVAGGLLLATGGYAAIAAGVAAFAVNQALVGTGTALVTGARVRELVLGDLVARRRSAVDVLEATAGATRLDEEQLLAWMRALNDVRLVLGTRLDVTEEGDERPVDRRDPRAPAFAVYDYLTYLQGEIIEALSAEAALFR
jgi:hypothetical protein